MKTITISAWDLCIWPFMVDMFSAMKDEVTVKNMSKIGNNGTGDIVAITIEMNLACEEKLKEVMDRFKYRGKVAFYDKQALN